MQHQLIDLIFILLALTALVGWFWYAYRHQALEAKHKGYEEGQARFQAMVEDQTDLIYRADADGNRLFVNEAYCRFFNRTHEELIGKPIGSFLDENDALKLRHVIAGLGPKLPRIPLRCGC